jgi:hypothetical protein
MMCIYGDVYFIRADILYLHKEGVKIRGILENPGHERNCAGGE